MPRQPDGSVTLENNLVRAVIAREGAVILSLFDKVRQREEVKVLPGVAGINEVRNYDRSRGAWRHYDLKCQDLPGGGRKVIATATLEDSNGRKRGELIKEYALPDDASAIRVALEIRNQGSDQIGQIPWVRHLIMRGTKAQPEEAHMTAYGARLSGRPIPGQPHLSPTSDHHYFPAANWTSRVVLPVEDGSNTFATVLHARDMLKIYNWHRGREDFCTQEVIGASMFVAPGASSRWEYFLTLAAPVRNIVYCSPELVVGVSPHPSFLAADTKDLTLAFSATRELKDLEVKARLVTVPDDKTVLSETSFMLSHVSPRKVCTHTAQINLADEANAQLRLAFLQGGKPHHPGAAVGETGEVIIPLVVGKQETPVVVFPDQTEGQSRLRRIEPTDRPARQVYAGNGLDVFSCLTAERCFRNDTFRKESEGPVQLYACAGEYESMQLALLPGTAAGSACTIVAPALQGPDGKTVPCESVNTFLYVPTSMPSKYNALFPTGEYPEALLPVEKVTLPENGHELLFVTYQVPQETPPGLYRGSLVLQEGTQKHAIPVEMTVWNVKLPKRHRGMEFASSLKGAALPLAKHADGTPYSRAEQRDAIVDMHLKYRLTPCDSGVANLLLYGKREAFEKEMAKFIAGGATKIYLGSIPSLLKRYEEELPGIESYLKEKGWIDYFYVRPGYDEASVDLVPQIRKVCLAWKKASSIPVMETYYHTERADELFGCIDIWSRSYPGPDWMDERVAAGDRFWKVNAMASILEMDPWLQGRKRYIDLWDKHVTGSYNWTVKNWRDIRDWHDGDYWCDGGVGNLSAVLMWPHETGILSTIRLEAMRDGLEDNALLWLLRDKVAEVGRRDGLDAAGKKALAQARELCGGKPLAERIQTCADLMALRRQAGDALSALNDLFPGK